MKAHIRLWIYDNGAIQPRVPCLRHIKLPRDAKFVHFCIMLDNKIFVKYILNNIQNKSKGGNLSKSVLEVSDFFQGPVSNVGLIVLIIDPFDSVYGLGVLEHVTLWTHNHSWCSKFFCKRTLLTTASWFSGKMLSADISVEPLVKLKKINVWPFEYWWQYWTGVSLRARPVCTAIWHLYPGILETDNGQFQYQSRTSPLQNIGRENVHIGSQDVICLILWILLLFCLFFLWSYIVIFLPDEGPIQMFPTAKCSLTQNRY